MTGILYIVGTPIGILEDIICWVSHSIATAFHDGITLDLDEKKLVIRIEIVDVTPRNALLDHG